MSEEHITAETVEEIAQLARVDLTSEEAEQFATELESVIDAFSVLDSVDTEDVDPAFHPVNVDRELRDDKRETSLPQEEALSNAAETNEEDDYFKGPRAV